MFSNILHGSNGEEIDTKKFALFASLGSIAESVFIYPLKLAKTRMQVERQGEVKFFSDLPRVFKEVTRESGLRGLYKGQFLLITCMVFKLLFNLIF
jgi:hypothetical protein